MTDAPWLDRQAYPFAAHHLTLPDGTLHYVDEGSGEVVLMVHGTPTWSFLYRHLITGLRDRYRVIAPDHLGFGLSDKPADYSYQPADQARNLRAFIEALDLKDITLVLHDFGGPFGLAYALDHPQNVRRIVLFNTWMWSLKGDFQKVIAGRFLGSPLGRWLCMRFNFEANVIMPFAYADRANLTRAIHTQYRRPLDDRSARLATWVYARELLNAAAWYDSLWARREILRDIPALLAWGMKDPVFGADYLARWREVFADPQVVTYPESGHFVTEEAGTALVPDIAAFLDGGG